MSQANVYEPITVFLVRGGAAGPGAQGIIAPTV